MKGIFYYEIVSGINRDYSFIGFVWVSMLIKEDILKPRWISHNKEQCSVYRKDYHSTLAFF